VTTVTLILLVTAALASASCAETSSTRDVIGSMGFMPLTRPMPSPTFTPPTALMYATSNEIPETVLSPCFHAGELLVTAITEKFTPFATIRLSDGLRYVPGEPDDFALQAHSIVNINVAFGATVKEHADSNSVMHRVAAIGAATGDDEARCKAALSRMVSGLRCFRAYLAISALKTGAMRYQFLTADGRKVPMTDDLVRLLRLQPAVVTKPDPFTLEVKTAMYIGYDVLWSFSMSGSPSPGAIPVLGTAESSSTGEGHDLLTGEIPPLPSGFLRITGHSGFRDLMDFRTGLCL
jgi:hypothetical protein